MRERPQDYSDINKLRRWQGYTSARPEVDSGFILRLMVNRF